MHLITDILITYLLMTDLNDHCSHVVTITREANIDDPHLIEINESLSDENAKLTLALNQERQNEHTKVLGVLDDKRDSDYKCLKLHTQADTFNDNITILNAAVRVYRIFENHGLSLYKESYAKESAQLESLFVELDEADNQADLQLLGLVGKYENLKASQSAFSAAFAARSIEAGKKAPIVPAYQIQKVVKETLKDMTDYINQRVRRKKASYENLAIAIDDLTDNINKKTRSRITAKEKKAAKDKTAKDKADEKDRSTTPGKDQS